MNERTEQLRAIMTEHQLSTADVGKILKRAPMTVRVWRCKNGSRTIPDHSLKLLALAVAKSEDNQQAAA